MQWYSFLSKPPGTKRAGDSWEGGESTDEQGRDVIEDLKREHEVRCREGAGHDSGRGVQGGRVWLHRPQGSSPMTRRFIHASPTALPGLDF